MTNRHAEDMLRMWLPAVQLDPAQLQHYELLHGGVSGSAVYRLYGFAHPYILKITLADAPPYVHERAQRELAFYQSPVASLPIAIPQLYAAVMDPAGAGSALLLAAYHPMPQPSKWTSAQYMTVAQQLAQLHARYWGRTEQLSIHPWLRPYHEPAAQTIADAREAWWALQQKPRFAALFTPSRRQHLDHLLATSAHMPANGSALPYTLCHQDCHIDNLLRDDHDRIVWADWQEVGIGYGPDDLSFFYQRASSAGATVPLTDMLRIYHQHLMASTGQPIELRALQARMATHELQTRLLHWPMYLLDAEPANLAAQLQRIEELAAVG